MLHVNKPILCLAYSLVIHAGIVAWLIYGYKPAEPVNWFPVQPIQVRLVDDYLQNVGNMAKPAESNSLGSSSDGTTPEHELESLQTTTQSIEHNSYEEDRESLEESIEVEPIEGAIVTTSTPAELAINSDQRIKPAIDSIEDRLQLESEEIELATEIPNSVKPLIPSIEKNVDTEATVPELVEAETKEAVKEVQEQSKSEKQLESSVIPEIAKENINSVPNEIWETNPSLNSVDELAKNANSPTINLDAQLVRSTSNQVNQTPVLDPNTDITSIERLTTDTNNSSSSKDVIQQSKKVTENEFDEFNRLNSTINELAANEINLEPKTNNLTVDLEIDDIDHQFSNLNEIEFEQQAPPSNKLRPEVEFDTPEVNSSSIVGETIDVDDAPQIVDLAQTVEFEDFNSEISSMEDPGEFNDVASAKLASMSKVEDFDRFAKLPYISQLTDMSEDTFAETVESVQKETNQQIASLNVVDFEHARLIWNTPEFEEKADADVDQQVQHLDQLTSEIALLSQKNDSKNIPEEITEPKELLADVDKEEENLAQQADSEVYETIDLQVARSAPMVLPRSDNLSSKEKKTKKVLTSQQPVQETKPVELASNSLVRQEKKQKSTQTLDDVSNVQQTSLKKESKFDGVPSQNELNKNTSAQKNQLTSETSNHIQQIAAHSSNSITTIPAQFFQQGYSNPLPRYPRLSRARGEEGEVVLQATVNPFGEVTKVTIVSSSGYSRLDKAAVKAVRKWKAVPAQQGDRVVMSVVEIPLSFVLKN